MSMTRFMPLNGLSAKRSAPNSSAAETEVRRALFGTLSLSRAAIHSASSRLAIVVHGTMTWCEDEPAHSK
jgi:hypothetical protein